MFFENWHACMQTRARSSQKPTCGGVIPIYVCVRGQRLTSDQSVSEEITSLCTPHSNHDDPYQMQRVGVCLSHLIMLCWEWPEKRDRANKTLATPTPIKRVCTTRRRRQNNTRIERRPDRQTDDPVYRDRQTDPDTWRKVKYYRFWGALFPTHLSYTHSKHGVRGPHVRSCGLLEAAHVRHQGDA